MIAMSLGAFSTGGFSTIPVRRCSRRTPSGWLRRFHTWRPRLSRQAQQRDDGSVLRLRHVDQLAQAGVSQSKISSGSTTANGSSPTAVLACSTACPMPSGCGLLHRRDAWPGLRSAAPSPAARCLFRSLQESVRAPAPVGKWSISAPLPGLVTITMSVIPSRDDFFDDDLDRRRVDYRQQFLGHHLGRGQHPGAKAGGEDNSFANLQWRLIIPGSLFRCDNV